MHCIKCGKFANFGLASTQVIQYCRDHKINGCINLTRALGLRSTRNCIYCSRKANYNHPGMHHPRSCHVHKTTGMVAYYKRTCNNQPCDERAVYGFDDMVTVYCEAHKKPGMLNIIHGVCHTLGCKKESKYKSHGGLHPTHCEDHRGRDQIL